MPYLPGTTVVGTKVGRLMAYQAEISRQNPTAFVFLVDQSGSMADEFKQEGLNKRKCDAVADALNRLIGEIAIRCAKQEAVRDYFTLALIGYGGTAHPAWGGDLSGQLAVPISAVDAHPIRYDQRTRMMDDGAGGLVPQTVDFPVWLEPAAASGTPMCAALQLALDFLTEWVSAHPQSYPPVVFNVTDGESTDGDPAALMQAVRQLATSDGNVILANVHLSSLSQEAIRYPLFSDPLPQGDQFAPILRDNASALIPPWVAPLGEVTGRALSSSNATFVYNASIVELIQLLNVGTRVDLR